MAWSDEARRAAAATRAAKKKLLNKQVSIAKRGQFAKALLSARQAVQPSKGRSMIQNNNAVRAMAFRAFMRSGK